MKSVLTAIVTMLVLSLVGHAEIPQVMSYQGRVSENSGNPVADGSWVMQFRIYDAETGGSLLWDSGALPVEVIGGVFNVMLGEPPHPALNLAFDGDYWLFVTFDGEDQLPRKRLASVGYAYMASGLVPGTEIYGSVTSSYGGALVAINSATASDVSGLYGYASGGAGVTHGVYAESNSPDGDGLFARATAGTGQTYGVYAQNFSTSGIGVFGEATATTGGTSGVRGECSSIDGTGVYGLASASLGWNVGVYGETSSEGGDGVHGKATATSGFAYGGYFETASTSGRAVFGRSSATGGTAYGVYGESASTSGIGVFGEATATTGATYGVRGKTSSTFGGAGVYGWATAADSSWSPGVWGRYDGSPSVGFGVYYTGGLAGTGGKSCVVRTSQGPTTFYCQESPESWFEDFGESWMSNGRAHVELDPLFLEAVTIDNDTPMKVFVELAGDCLGVYVDRARTGFDVIELQGGMSSVPFAYRVVAKRKGFEARRLDVCEAARTDPYLYPEYREKQERELKEDRARMDEQAERMQTERSRMR